MKKYNIQYNIGRAKYCVNYSDGIKKNLDGSEFWGIKIYRNKKDFNICIKEFKIAGYIEKEFEHSKKLTL